MARKGKEHMPLKIWGPHPVGLGWFSLGLGLYEAASSGSLSRSLGLEGHEGLLRFYGVREITDGVGIFKSQPQPAPWVWARGAGDALDLATLTAALLRLDNPKRGNAGLAFASVVGVTVLDVLCAQRLSGRPNHNA